MGNDARHRHVQCPGDVEQRIPVFEDRRHELVGQVAVRPAVAARVHPLGKTWLPESGSSAEPLLGTELGTDDRTEFAVHEAEVSL